MPDWFAATGSPLDAKSLAAANAMLAALAHWSAVEVVSLPSTDEMLIRQAEVDADGSWWNLQETEREALWQPGSDRHGEGHLAARLAEQQALAAPAIAAAAARRFAASPSSVARAAREAAELAFHHAALARISGADQHWFVFKQALFEHGHWPLGVHRGRLLIF